jgi:hypothetical protein
LIIFKNWLLKCQIFIKEKDRKIYVHDPELGTIYRRKISPSNTLFLLWGLSGALANFFLSRKSDARFYLELRTKPLSIIEDLKSYKGVLINSGIVKKEDKFDEVYVTIGEWMYKLVHSQKEIIAVYSKKHREELVAVLYPYFKNLTDLHDTSIYRFIGHILKHLGREKGDVRDISKRIRKRLERKGIKKELVKKDLDVERLKETLLRLIK